MSAIKIPVVVTGLPIHRRISIAQTLGKARFEGIKGLGLGASLGYLDEVQRPVTLVM